MLTQTQPENYIQTSNTAGSAERIVRSFIKNGNYEKIADFLYNKLQKYKT